MQTNPISNPSPTRPSNFIQPPPPQFPQELSPEDISKQRWKILFLICSCTFGASFISDSLMRSVIQKREAFGLSGRDQSQAMMKFLYLTSIIAGLMIQRFGIIKTFRSLVVPLIFGSLLAVYSLQTHSYFLFLSGEALIRGPALGLRVAQIYMIIKWFKGKELSLAIGVLCFSRSIDYYIVLLFNSYIESLGMQSILSFGMVLCILAGVAVIFLSKIRQEGEGALVEAEEEKMNKPVTAVLIITIICVELAKKERWEYWTVMISSRPEFFRVFAKFEPFTVFVPIILYPLFGFLADKKGGRTTGVFLSLLLFFIGNVLFSKAIGSVESSSYFILVPSFLSLVGSLLFEVSVWGILGSFTPKRVLGVVLGIASSLAYFGSQFLALFMPAPEKGLVYALGVILIIGILSMFYAWIGLKKKEDFSSQEEVSNQPQIIQAEA